MAQEILTETGFDRPSLAELVKRVGDNLAAVVGPINRDPDAGIGQLIGSFSESLGVTFETAEAVFLSRFLSSAEGSALDAIGEWMGGNTRKGKTKTRVNVILYAPNGTTIPAGSLASYNSYMFELQSDVVVSTANTTDITIRYTAQTSGNVGVRINAVPYEVPAANKQPFEITNTLAGLINAAGTTSGQVLFSAVADGANLHITSPNINSGLNVVATGIGVSVIQLGTPGLMVAQETGAIVLPAHLLITPVTAVPNWQAIDNPVEGATGSDRESDTDYRNRLGMSQGLNAGKATPEAIKAGLLTVSGVTSVTVIVNNKLTKLPSGQLPKSFMCVVQGGLEQDIFNAIWIYGGAGIETYGSVQGTAIDSNGDAQPIDFARVQGTSIDVNVEVDGLSTEEIISTGARTLIEQGIRAYFATLGLGDDVIPQRMYGYVYNLTSGIIHMNITAGLPGALVATATGIDPDRMAIPGTITITGQV